MAVVRFMNHVFEFLQLGMRVLRVSDDFKPGALDRVESVS